MQRLVIYALGINDVRDIFGADETLAGRLREAARAHYSEAPPQRRRWFGPLLRRDPATEVDPGRPSTADVDALLSGGFVSSERVTPCWRLLHVWFAELAPASRAVDYDEDLLDRVEWELATLGLGSDHALRSLAERRLGVPLAPLPGQVVGYAKHLHAVEVLRHLRPILELPELTAETAAFVGPIVEVLAAAEGDERLDILAIGTV